MRAFVFASARRAAGSYRPLLTLGGSLDILVKFGEGRKCALVCPSTSAGSRQRIALIPSNL